MAKLYPLTSSEDSRAGGFLVVFPSGLRQEITWQRNAPAIDTLAESKTVSARLLDDLLQAGKTDDAERTNWPSITAAIQRIVMDWNDKRKAALYAIGPGTIS